MGAVPALFPLLADVNFRVVQAATGAIQSLGSGETKARALEAASSPNLAVKRAALRILAYFGYREGLPYFLNALKGDAPRVRRGRLLDPGGVSLAGAGPPGSLAVEENVLLVDRRPQLREVRLARFERKIGGRDMRGGQQGGPRQTGYSPDGDGSA